jgi:hypothetical protein
MRASILGKLLKVSLLAVLGVSQLINTNTIPVSADSDTRQIQVPIVVDLTYAIAGAEFAFEYTSGLSFITYQKSEAVSSALVTPDVVKNGSTYLGFYNTTNRYAPSNGRLDLGTFIFNYSGNNKETVYLSQIKIVTVIDSDTTESRFLEPREYSIEGQALTATPINPTGSTSPNNTSKSPTIPSSNTPPSNDPQQNNWMWLIVVSIIAVVGICLFFIIKRRTKQK